MTHLVQIRYQESLFKYLLPVLSVFELPPKLRVVHLRKKFKISIFSKMALTILFKFGVFIVHSKSNNMTLSDFSGKILETRKIVFNFCLSRNVASKPTDQSCSNSISGVPLQIFPVSLFFFLLFLFVFDLP